MNVQPLKDSMDRKWKDESPQTVIVLAANAIYWRRKHIEDLEAKNTAMQIALDHIAEGAPSANVIAMNVLKGVSCAHRSGL